MKETKESKGSKKKASSGRHKIPLDWDRIAYIIRCGGKGSHAASDQGVHADTIYGRCKTDQGMDYSDFYALHRQKGDALLFIKEFEQALEGDRTMLIWLAKNRLGQSDNPQVEQEFSGKLAEILDHIKNKPLSNEFTKISVRKA